MDSSQKRILVVDDDESNLFLLTDMLKELDVIPIVAESGTEALSFARNHAFALILLDVDMPGMSGYQVLNQLSSDARTSEIPIIFMKPNLGDNNWKLHGRSMAAVDCIYKPVNKTILLDRVSAYLSIDNRLAHISTYYKQNLKSTETLTEGMLALNESGCIIYANPTAVAMLRTTLPNLIGLYFETLLERSHHSVLSNWNDHILCMAGNQNKVTKVERALFWCADGLELTVTFVLMPMQNKIKGVRSIIVFNEIKNQAYMDEKLSALIKYDPLTRLANRDSLEETCEVAIQSLKKGKSLAIILWGLDHFTYVNESLGHDIGDQLLRSVSQRMMSNIGKTSTLARLGSDEFVILLPSISSEKVAITTWRALMSVFDEPFLVGGHEVFLGASAGISTYPKCGENISRLLANAEKALQKAKVSGKHKFEVYNSSMTQRSIENLDLETELHYVLARDELFLSYLPIINLADKKMIGVEAQLSWQHPQKGVLPYNSFVDIAEEAGLMPAIGQWMVTTAIENYVKWQLNFDIDEFTLSLKVSIYQLLHREFTNSLRKLINNCPIEAAYLELEIIESNLNKENHLAFVEALTQLRELGVRIILNDFGSNYMSLSTINKIEIHGVKLNEGFIQSVVDTDHGNTIIKSVIDLAHGFDAEVIGVGINNEREMQLLEQNGCDKVQGDFYYGSMDGAEFELLISGKNGGAGNEDRGAG